MHVCVTVTISHLNAEVFALHYVTAAAFSHSLYALLLSFEYSSYLMNIYFIDVF